jgi:hypothetical protein
MAVAALLFFVGESHRLNELKVVAQSDHRGPQGFVDGPRFVVGASVKAEY